MKNYWNVVVVGVVWLLVAMPVGAHPELTTSVRHRAQLVVGPKNVDVTVELTLGEVPAFAERLLMDGNRNGTVDEQEVQAYLDEHSETLQQAVSLMVAGKPVELLFLYDPEIELGSEQTAVAAHLVVRLFYFARTPGELKAGDELVLADRLWSHSPSLVSFHAVGDNGVEIAAEKSEGTIWSLPGDRETLEMRARCLTVPEGVAEVLEAKHIQPTKIAMKRASTDRYEPDWLLLGGGAILMVCLVVLVGCCCLRMGARV